MNQGRWPDTPASPLDHVGRNVEDVITSLEIHEVLRNECRAGRARDEQLETAIGIRHQSEKLADGLMRVCLAAEVLEKGYPIDDAEGVRGARLVGDERMHQPPDALDVLEAMS